LRRRSQRHTAVIFDGWTAAITHDYACKHGDAEAAELDCVPMPDSVVKLVQGAWKAQLKDASGAAIY
jgi:hypothetical protein